MNTYDELVALLAPEFKLDPTLVDGAQDLTAYGLDSLAFVDVMFLVEEHFGIDLPNDTAEFRTLNDLAALIDGLMIPEAA